MVPMSNCCLDDIMLALESDTITFVFSALHVHVFLVLALHITGNNVIIILVEVTHIQGGIWEQTVQRNTYSRYPHTYSTLDFCHHIHTHQVKKRATVTNNQKTCIFMYGGDYCTLDRVKSSLFTVEPLYKVTPEISSCYFVCTFQPLK